ncbi:MFS transporter [Ktedonosporobacter rubrisoli]|nr:MFS transporter [Ktedonosporobacter rubrisoli]
MKPTEKPLPLEYETIPPGKGPLINRNFALLCAGQAISTLGDFVYSTMLVMWVFTLTHSAAAVSGVLIAQYGPLFLLGPLAGVFVDRWDRRRTMIVADVARAFVVLGPLLLENLWQLPAIYLSAFLLSCFECFFMPAKSGLLQVIVAEEQQTKAASVSQTIFALSLLAGPALAAVLYASVGPTAAILIDAGSFLASALSLRIMRVSPQVLRPSVFRMSENGGIRQLFSELLDGVHMIVKTPTLRVVILLAFVGMFGAGALNALDIVFVSRNLHAAAPLYGSLVAVGGLGALLGAIGAGIISKWVSPKVLLTASVFLGGVGILLYSFQTVYGVALTLTFLLSLPQGGIDVGYEALLITSTPRNMMGRVQALLETGIFAASFISACLAGYLGQILPVNIIFAGCGALILLAGLLGWLGLAGAPRE